TKAPGTKGLKAKATTTNTEDAFVAVETEPTTVDAILAALIPTKEDPDKVLIRKSIRSLFAPAVSPPRARCYEKREKFASQVVVHSLNATALCPLLPSPRSTISNIDDVCPVEECPPSARFTYPTESIPP